MNHTYKLKIVLPVLLLFYLNTLSATLITWTGSNGNIYWADEGNWLPKQVPKKDDEVIIPSNSGDVFIHDDEWTILQLTVFDNSRLLINADATLMVSGSPNNGVTVLDEGIIENDGLLWVTTSAVNGVAVGGILENRGELVLEFSGSNGLHSSGYSKVINERSGTIYFFPNDQYSLEILYPSKLENHGKMRFVEQDTDVGVLVTGIWNNKVNSQTTFERRYEGGLLLTLGGNLWNRGYMEFESKSPSNLIKIDEGTLVNKSQGHINIKPRSSNGFLTLYVDFLGEFENKGLFEVDLKSGNQRGAFVRGKFFNRASGDFSVRDGREGINNFAAAGSFINEGDLGIYDVFPFGLLNTGSIENKGTLTLDEISSFNNNGVGEIINDGGTISLGDLQPTIMENNGQITNRVCSKIEFFGSFTNNGTIDNEGHLILDSRGYGSAPSTGIINNDAVLSDPRDQWASQVSNQGIRLIPVSNDYGGNVYYDVIDIASGSDFYITRGRWYLDAGLQNIAGVYSFVQNTFTGFNGNNTNTLYAEVTNYSGTCTMVVPIPFFGYLPSANENNPLQFVEAHATANSATANTFKVYPNPNKGTLHLELSPAWEGSLDFRLVDVNGRIVWQEQKDAADWSTFNWRNQIAGGIYGLQIWHAGQLLGQEKLVLMEH